MQDLTKIIEDEKNIVKHKNIKIQKSSRSIDEKLKEQNKQILKFAKE